MNRWHPVNWSCCFSSFRVEKEGLHDPRTLLWLRRHFLAANFHYLSSFFSVLPTEVLLLHLRRRDMTAWQPQSTRTECWCQKTVCKVSTALWKYTPYVCMCVGVFVQFSEEASEIIPMFESQRPFFWRHSFISNINLVPSYLSIRLVLYLSKDTALFKPTIFYLSRDSTGGKFSHIHSGKREKKSLLQRAVLKLLDQPSTPVR